MRGTEEKDLGEGGLRRRMRGSRRRRKSRGEGSI